MAFDISFGKFKANFFRPELILKRIEREKRKALSKAGAFVRQRARTSIRKRKAISQPGQPPSSHSGELRKLLFFAYDPSNDSVVVGPAAFKRSEAPKLLEFGGIVKRPRPNGTVRTLRYRPRPFMAPALAAEMPKFADLLRGMIN
jgi:hypothetical protein